MRREVDPVCDPAPDDWAEGSVVKTDEVCYVRRPLSPHASGHEKTGWPPARRKQALPRIVWSLTVGDVGRVLAGLRGGIAWVVTIWGCAGVAA